MELIQKFSIDCAHHIQDSDELITKRCANTHGHTYHITVRLDNNMIMSFYKVKRFVDFSLIKDDIKKILNEYDHQDITEKFGITTVENFTEAIFKDIVQLYECDYNRIKLEIMETDNSGASL